MLRCALHDGFCMKFFIVPIPNESKDLSCYPKSPSCGRISSSSTTAWGDRP